MDMVFCKVKRFGIKTQFLEGTYINERLILVKNKKLIDNFS